MKLNNHVLALIAVGASITANCQPCLEHNVGTALKYGADVQEIAEAIEVGKRVRQGVAAKMDKFVADLNTVVYSATPIPNIECECSPQATATGGRNG